MSASGPPRGAGAKAVPHRGQNLAWGLHGAWQWLQVFSLAWAAAPPGGAGSCGMAEEDRAAPQRLQNLAVAAR